MRSPVTGYVKGKEIKNVSTCLIETNLPKELIPVQQTQRSKVL
jgi:hypothetical protein